MKTAVFKTGGKQYLATEGDVLKVEKLVSKAGEKVTFTEVLLTATEKTTKIGSPQVSGASVEAIIKGHGKGRKVTGVKMKAKKRYRRLLGHRQRYTEIQITKVKTQ